jgi:hypothetical protein
VVLPVAAVADIAVYLTRHNSLIFLTMSTGALVITLIITFVIISGVLLIFIPRISQIASREVNTTLIRQVSVTLKLVSLFLILAALPTAITAQALATHQYQSSIVWQNAASAVTLQYSSDNEQNTKDGQKAQPFFEAVEKTGTMALSYPVGSALMDTQGSTSPITEQIHFGEYDQVIITDDAFLKLMKVPTTSLKKVQQSQIPDDLRASLKEYDSIWLEKGASESLTDNTYKWTGDTLFPALSYGEATGSMSQARNPLIIRLSNPAQTLDGANLLLPAVSTGNVIFTDAPLAMKTLQHFGLGESFYSATKITDSILLLAQQAQASARMSTLAVITSLIVILFCAIASARTWAAERIRTIFLLHSSGTPYWQILRGRIFASLASIVVIGSINYSLISSWKMIDYSIPWMVGILAVYFCIELLFGFTQSARAFKRAIAREQE